MITLSPSGFRRPFRRASRVVKSFIQPNISLFSEFIFFPPNKNHSRRTSDIIGSLTSLYSEAYYGLPLCQRVFASCFTLVFKGLACRVKLTWKYLPHA